MGGEAVRGRLVDRWGWWKRRMATADGSSSARDETLRVAV